MRCRAHAVLAVLGLQLGCDSSPSLRAPATLPPGPHHGIMIGLADDKGFIELVNEPEVKDRRKLEPTSIVAYFLQNDAKSPLSPTPTDVRFAIEGGRPGQGTRGGRPTPQSVPLDRESKPDDPASTGRFASKPGPYYLEVLRGTLSAKLGSETISTPINGGR